MAPGGRAPGRRAVALGALALAGAAALGTLAARRSGLIAPRPLSAARAAALYAAPLAPPAGAMRVFHLGHSLVGRDMPAMLAQIAPPGHASHSQLGWGASLRDHWRGPDAVAGFAAENAHPAHRPAFAALDGGGYDAVVLTEMVEIRAAIAHHASWRHLRAWARRARAARPDVRLYLYETWHPLDDPEGWLARLDADPARYWRREILDRAQARPLAGGPIRVIPAGSVLAAAVRAIEGAGGTPALPDRRAFFAPALFAPDNAGAVDPIHLGDLGNYLVALTHAAVLYHRLPPVPAALARADGSPAVLPDPEGERLLRAAVAGVVANDPRSGVARLAGAEG